jgi:hypothetical protein
MYRHHTESDRQVNCFGAFMKFVGEVFPFSMALVHLAAVAGQLLAQAAVRAGVRPVKFKTLIIDTKDPPFNLSNRASFSFLICFGSAIRMSCAMRVTTGLMPSLGGFIAHVRRFVATARKIGYGLLFICPR